MPRWVEPVEVSRSYEIVSATGRTHGTSYQRLLAFTLARRKAPEALLELLMSRYRITRRLRHRQVITARRLP